MALKHPHGGSHLFIHAFISPATTQQAIHPPTNQQSVLTLAGIEDGDTLLLGELAQVGHLATEVHGCQTAPEAGAREHAVLDVVLLEELLRGTACSQHMGTGWNECTTLMT